MQVKKKRKNPKISATNKTLRPPLFVDRSKLLEYARSFLSVELGRFEQYVTLATTNVKVSDAPPFPLLLYCMSVLDLLGALYSGNASKNADYSAQSRAYLVDIMGWSVEKARILRALFRNQLAHLAAPATVIVFDGKRISWTLSLGVDARHFLLEKLPVRESLPLFGPYRLDFDYRFVLSMLVLYYDIRDSVQKYLSALDSSTELQDKFETAIAHIFGLL
jgi:hypothetical protein